MDIHIIIMAGGVGSRLWPISTAENPKQFIDVLGVGKSLIQLTVERFSALAPMSNFWIVTSEKYADKVKDQLPNIPEDNILCEPEARNTAPCIAYSCWKIAKKYPKANLIVTPSDAIIINPEKFIGLIEKSLLFTEKKSSIVTVGIKPSRPDTGYGYIEVDSFKEGEITKVKSFKEKPNLETAEHYFSDGNYFWNAGIFVWNVETINRQISRFAPQIADVMNLLEPSFYTENESAELKRLFPTCDKISIDYAVMEKSEDIYVVPADIMWSDLGGWNSVGKCFRNDEDGNMILGNDVSLFNSKDCVVHVKDSKKVILSSLDGYIVSQLNGNLLVCKISEEQQVKDYLNKK